MQTFLFYLLSMQSEENGKKNDTRRIVIGVSISAVFVAFFGLFIYLLSPVSAKFALAPEVVFEIKPGDGYGKIISQLTSSGLIRSRSALVLLSMITGSAMNLKPGTYHLRNTMSGSEILSALVSGSQKEVSLTVVEGYSVYDIDRLLASAGVLKAGELVNANKKNSFEGTLFPDTYRFFTDSTVSEVLQKFRDTFLAKAGPILTVDGAMSTSTLVLASIVEKEVPDFEDRKIVAGILKKRIEAGVPLQVDSSVCYIKEAEVFPIAEKCYPLNSLDFKLVSPYNTYMHGGLPPGPIGNPGLSAVVAAMHPKSSPYWYYLSDPATQKTIFSRDLDEQEANRVKYLGTKKG